MPAPISRELGGGSPARSKPLAPVLTSGIASREKPVFAAMLLLVADPTFVPASQSRPMVGLAVTPPRSPRPLQALFSPDDYPA